MADPKVYREHGVEYIEDENGVFGLGLNQEACQVLHFPTLASRFPLLSWDKIREVVQSEDFQYGRQYFDRSWTTNQGAFGSCAAYAGSSALAKARVIMGQPRVDLSGDYLYSLVNRGRDRGSILADNMKAIMNNGVAKASTVPRGQIYRNRYNTSVADAEARNYRGHELFTIPDEQSMATALCLKGLVVHAIHVGRNWRRFDSDGMLAPAPGRGNHSEHNDDIRYNTRTNRFEYRKATSHGTNYGQDGYCWTNWRDHYAPTIRYHVFYAVMSAVEDGTAPSPPSPEGTSPEPQPDPVNINPILTMSTRSGCSWCTKFSNEESPKAIREGWTVEVEPNSSGSVPRFRLYVDGVERNFTGFKTFEFFQQQAREMGNG